jgi:hypothetical protein
MRASVSFVNSAIELIEIRVIPLSRSSVCFDIMETTCGLITNPQRDSTSAQEQSVLALRFEENPKPIVINAVQAVLIGPNDESASSRTKIYARRFEPRSYSCGLIYVAAAPSLDFTFQYFECAEWEFDWMFEGSGLLKKEMSLTERRGLCQDQKKQKENNP